MVRFINPKAKRTRLVLGHDGGGGIAADRRFFLTGTPAESRPKEFFPILNSLRPDLFPSFEPFAYRYCNARQSRYGLEADGSSNEEELQAILRENVMVRRSKKEALKDLPDNIRVRIPLPCNGKFRKLVDAELDAWKREKNTIARLRETGAPAEEVRKAQNDANSRLNRLRLATSEAKLPMCLDFLRTAAAQDKIVVFAKHFAVIDPVVSEFEGRCAVVHGRIPSKERQIE